LRLKVVILDAGDKLPNGRNLRRLRLSVCCAHWFHKSGSTGQSEYCINNLFRSPTHVQDVHVTDSSVARGGSPVKQPEALEAIERSKIVFVSSCLFSD
jgi:hypothetical protein